MGAMGGMGGIPGVSGMPALNQLLGPGFGGGADVGGGGPGPDFAPASGASAGWLPPLKVGMGGAPEAMAGGLAGLEEAGDGIGDGIGAGAGVDDRDGSGLSGLEPPFSGDHAQ